jgi:hypothetical protein
MRSSYTSEASFYPQATSTCKTCTCGIQKTLTQFFKSLCTEEKMASGQRFLIFWLLRTPLNRYWKPQNVKSFLRCEPQNNTQKINKHTNYKIFNSKTKKLQKSEFQFEWEGWCCISVTSFSIFGFISGSSVLRADSTFLKHFLYTSCAEIRARPRSG